MVLLDCDPMEDLALGCVGAGVSGGTHRERARSQCALRLPLCG